MQDVDSQSQDVNQALQQLEAIRASGRKYHFVQQASLVLRQVDSLPELVLPLLHGLVELGFGGPAREVLQARRDLPITDEQLDVLRGAIHDLPDGRVPWSTRRECFTRNVDALLRHRPHLADHVEPMKRALGELDLYQTHTGEFQLARAIADPQTASPVPPREWLPILSDEGDDAQVKLPPRSQLGATVIVGVRIGPLIPRIYQQTDRLFLNHSAPIFLIEPDLGRFAAWLHAAPVAIPVGTPASIPDAMPTAMDIAALLDDERVYVLLGASAVGDFRRLLRDEPDLAVPLVHVNLRPESSIAEQVRATAEQINSQRRDELDRIMDELNNQRRHRDVAYHAERIAKPTCAVGLTSRYTTMLQYSTRDALHALEERGCRTHTLIEKKDHHQLSPITIGRTLLELDPDLLIILDHLRYEYAHIPAHLPMLSWIQDPMDNLLCGRAGESIGPLDFVCGYYRHRCIDEFGYPAQQFLTTQIPVSTRLFHDCDLDDSDRAQLACDVSFVSNASTPLDEFHAATLRDYPPQCHAMFEALRAIAPELGRDTDHLQPMTAAPDVVRSVAGDLSLELTDVQVHHVATNYLYRLYDWGRRQEALTWAARWAGRTNRVLKIYGRGWQRHPVLAPFAAGPIEHGEPLRRVYRASKLSLQLIASGFRHQRSYELLAAGTLPLTRYCKADHEQSEEQVGFPGLDRITFKTADEFEALAERFLADDASRRGVVAELRSVVLREHTYTAVMDDVLSAWHRHLCDAASLATAPIPVPTP